MGAHNRVGRQRSAPRPDLDLARELAAAPTPDLKSLGIIVAKEVLRLRLELHPSLWAELPERMTSTRLTSRHRQTGRQGWRSQRGQKTGRRRSCWAIRPLGRVCPGRTKPQIRTVVQIAMRTSLPSRQFPRVVQTAQKMPLLIIIVQSASLPGAEDPG